MIEIQELPLKDAKVLKLKRNHDNRGWFTEIFRQSWLQDAGIQNKFIFDYISYSKNTSTVRGMHSQTAIQPQAKLVTAINGSIQDTIIDARIDSPTYGKSCSIIISKDDPCVIYVPTGFYHGFITLSPDTYVVYKLDAYYNGEAECGLTWNDPSMSIEWDIKNEITISDRDKNHLSWENCYKFSEK